jgi:serine protease Do
MANSDQIKVGQWAIAVGNPFSKSLSQTVTAGIVSGLSRSSVGLDTDVDFLQTDAAINPGNSGGALVNLSGELLGVNTAILSRSGGYEGIGFAIPSNTARSIMDQIIKNGKVIRGYVGIRMQDVDEEMARAMGLGKARGAVIADIVKDSPADKADLHQGDVIIKVDGQEVADGSAIRKAIVRKAPGTRVALTILREGTETVVSVTLAEFPDEDVQMKEDSAARKSSEIIGIKVSNASSELAGKYGFGADEKGVVIVDIDQSGPAFRAGLREGDLIKRVGKREVRNLKDYSDAMAGLNKGDTALFLVNRRGSSMFIAFTVPNQ